MQKKLETKMENPQVCECYHGDVEEEKKKKQNNTTSPVHVVLKIDFHCDGCIARIVRLSRRLEGTIYVQNPRNLNR